jgi:hypothetical protein
MIDGGETPFSIKREELFGDGRDRLSSILTSFRGKRCRFERKASLWPGDFAVSQGRRVPPLLATRMMFEQEQGCLSFCNP